MFADEMTRVANREGGRDRGAIGQTGAGDECWWYLEGFD